MGLFFKNHASSCFLFVLVELRAKVLKAWTLLPETSCADGLRGMLVALWTQ